MRKCLLLTVLFFIANHIMAQEAEVKKGCGCRFQSINQAGVLQGEWSGYGLIQTINGIRYKKWFAGVGTGIDYYKYRGVPFFADVRHYILSKPNTPFLYADAGIHFNWLTADQKNKGWTGVTSDFKNGFYSDVGLGYSVGFRKNMALLLSAGYSYKNITEKRSTEYWCLIPPCPQFFETYKYGLNRLSFKMGLQF